MRKTIANLVLLSGGILAALRMLFFDPGGIISRIFPNTLFEIATTDLPPQPGDIIIKLVNFHFHMIGVLYQVVAIIIITGVIFLVLRRD